MNNTSGIDICSRPRSTNGSGETGFQIIWARRMKWEGKEINKQHATQDKATISKRQTVQEDKRRKQDEIAVQHRLKNPHICTCSRIRFFRCKRGVGVGSGTKEKWSWRLRLGRGRRTEGFGSRCRPPTGYPSSTLWGVRRHLDSQVEGSISARH